MQTLSIFRRQDKCFSHIVGLYGTFGRLGTITCFLEYYQTMLKSSLCQRKRPGHSTMLSTYEPLGFPIALFYFPFQFYVHQAGCLESVDLSPGSATCQLSAILYTSLRKFGPFFPFFHGLVTKLILLLKSKI